MRRIKAGLIREKVKELCIQASTVLPEDVLYALGEARKAEEDPGARALLDTLMENAGLAREKALPVCQDTGLACVFLEIGQEVIVEGDIHSAVTGGVRDGYVSGYLRKSVVSDPLFDRTNTKDNTPPILYTEIVPGSGFSITVMPKGAGSENKSNVRALPPLSGPSGVKEFVIETVKSAGSDACPPLIVGVGIGGTLDFAASLSKRALLRPVGSSSGDERYDSFEKDCLCALNNLGIGPGGLGGKTTALAVHVMAYPTHMASLPVGVNLQCCAARRATGSL